MKETGLNRRYFLKTGVVAGIASGMAVKKSEAAEVITVDPDKVLNYNEDMGYRQLGNTDIYLSMVSMGGLVNEPGIHAYAIDQGCNLVHISTSYIGGSSIKKLGEVMKDKRDKVYIALKDNFFSNDDYKNADFSKIDDVLKTLNTDYIDFFMFNRHDSDSAKDELIQESFEKLKDMGKVRFSGLTTHGDVKGCMSAGIESGMYTLLNPVLNQPNLEALNEDLRESYEKGMGVMAMKTMKGMDTLDMQVAYLKKLLKNPGVTTVLKGIGSFEMFDAYKKASKEVLTSQEDRKLYHYAQLNRSNNCMMCDECSRECPQGVQVSTVLRCNDYYLKQENDYALAKETYHALASTQRGGEDCDLCHRCEEVCPNRINIVDRIKEARVALA